MNKNPKRQHPLLSAMCMFLTLVMLISYLPVNTAVAETESNGIDVVILLDTSTSMNTNDEDGYRIDAAQMFISMCDMGSRIAVIPFNQKIVDGFYPPEFITLDSESTRVNLINSLVKFRDITGHNTEMGIPLSLAVKMLSESDSGNSPMILLFSDGINSFDERAESDVFFWDAGSNSFQTKAYRKFTEQNSNELCDVTAKAAEYYGIPVYTIAFHSGDLTRGNAKTGYDFLQRLSNATGSECIPINANNAYDLPQVFGGMLADQIGSSLMITFEPIPVQGQENTYEIKIPILNDSVMEANIYIPLRSANGRRAIDDNQIWLYNPSGTDYTTGNGNQVLRFDSGVHPDPSRNFKKSFVLYKLRNAQNGEWTLRFKVNEGINVGDIAFSMLYNYNITLKNSIGTTPANLQIGDAPLTFNKKDRLILRSTFFDNETGAPSEDRALYNIVGDGSDWKTIKAHYEWLDNSGAVLFSGDLVPMQGSYYETQFDLSTILLDEQGNSQLRSGVYTLKVVTEGAGLQREISQVINLTNNPITFNGNVEEGIVWDIVVHDPENPETAAPMVHSLNLSDFFTDSDNDVLYFSLDSDGSETDVIFDLPQPLLKEDGNYYLEGTTIKNLSNGHIRSGIRNYVITVSDSESPIIVPLTVRILDMSQNLSDRYSPNVDTTGISGQGTAKKNDSVTFKINLIDNETGEADREGNIRFYSAQLQMVDASNTSRELHAGEFVQDGNYLTYTFETPNNGQEYKANFILSFNGEPLANNPESITFAVPNTAPVTVATALDDYPTKLGHQPESFPPVLEHVVTEEELTFDLDELFTEQDNETLVYSDPVFTCADPDANAADYIWFDRDGETITLHVKGNQKVNMKVTATDGDGEEAVFTREYSIVDLTERWTMYWIVAISAVILLILLIRAMYVAGLPAYNGNVAIEILEGSSIGVTTTSSLPSGKYRKKAVSIAQFINTEIAANNNIDTGALGTVMIKPRRHVKDGTVNIWASKVPAGLSVSINGNNIGRKIQPWSPDTEVLIASEGGSVRLRMKNEANPLTAAPTSTGGFSATSGAGGFGGVESSFGSFAPSSSSGSSEKGNTGFGGFDTSSSGGFGGGFGGNDANNNNNGGGFGGF